MQDIDGNYVNHGSWKMWDPAGRLVAQGEYRNNRRTGVWLRWYRNVAEAPLLTKMPYQKFVGPFVSQATFKDDKLDGTWTIYDGKMRKISQWRFADGKRHRQFAVVVSRRSQDARRRILRWRVGRHGRGMESRRQVDLHDTYQAGRKLAERSPTIPAAARSRRASTCSPRTSNNRPTTGGTASCW